jgi:uncharacterized protein YecT (DUF1311 family)
MTRSTKRPPTIVLTTAVILAVPLSLAAQATSQESGPPPAACVAILAKPFDGGLDPRIEPDCDSTAFYYGLQRDRDYAAAKSCALIERINHVEAKDGSPFPGAGILSMIYANDDGTPRDIDLAKRFVCENKEAATAETEARLALLDTIAKTPQTAGRYSLCTVANTTLTLGWCATLRLRVADSKRYDEMVAIVDKLPPAGVEAFKKLQAAEGDYEAARAQKEIDLTGAARAVWVLQEQDRIRAQFVSDLKLFSAAGYSQPVTFATVDALVNKDYASVRANGAKLFQGTTITVAGVEETQAAWLKYRDAWRAYEGVVNPTVSGDAVATQIDRERLTQLHKLNTMY